MNLLMRVTIDLVENEKGEQGVFVSGPKGEHKNIIIMLSEAISKVASDIDSEEEESNIIIPPAGLVIPK
jgi:hypothetical protein